MGFCSDWKLLNASDFGVPQLRPRVILVAMKPECFKLFNWPKPLKSDPITVGEALYDLMVKHNWPGADAWREKANTIAPTLVGGSKKHGGPDLGPTRAKQQWKQLGINGHRIGHEEEIPDKDFKGALLRDGTIREGYENMPLINVRMAARLQGFPDYWNFSGGKTNAYRQVGNAFPPPVAQAVGNNIYSALEQIILKKSDAA